MWQERAVNYIAIFNALYGLSYLIRSDNAVSNWVDANTPIRAAFLGIIIMVSGAMIKIIYGRNHDNWERMAVFLLPSSIAAILVVLQVSSTASTRSFSPPQHAIAHLGLVITFWLFLAIGSHIDDLIAGNIALREQLDKVLPRPDGEVVIQ